MKTGFTRNYYIFNKRKKPRSSVDEKNKDQNNTLSF